MKNIYLMRHGDTEATEKGYFAGWSDVPLSERGKIRVKKAAPQLAKRKFRRIFTSPMARALETASLLFPDREKLEVVPELKERSFGAWEGKSWERLEGEEKDSINEWKNSPLSFTPPGGESFSQVLKRVTGFWKYLASLEEGDYLAVAHAGVMRCVLVHITGISFENSFRWLIDPAAILHVRDDHIFPQVIALWNVEVE